jgi:hypothetical protein
MRLKLPDGTSIGPVEPAYERPSAANTYDLPFTVAPA